MGVQPSVRQIGKYVVVDVIGAGGMGIVYRANDPAIGRTVAIKMLKQSEAEDPNGLLERFFSREMRSTASMNHKNIVTVYDSGDHDGNPYLVMEYLEGEPTSKIIAERRPLSLVEKLDLLIQVCDGLQYAHDREIVHRDIKPANVIRLSDGIVKIVDFGVSRVAGSETSLVQTGHLVGSLSYMSPEQINSMPIDGRSDIFSAGVMLYELLTYVLPFKAADPGATFVKILREEPAPLASYVKDLPANMQAVMNRALAKKAADRYQSAEEFGFDLLQVQKELKDITILDCMKRADVALQRGDLERARLHLQEITKLDRQHERANRLLRDVRKAIQQQQRSSQVIQMRSQAQVALAGMQYEEALACADQALRLDPTDQESIHLCDEIRIAISRAKAVREALNRAETATFAGDFDEAKEAIEESLRLSPNDSEARALALLVNKELAERSRRLQVQEFVDSARRGIAERKFVDAIDALHQAEQLDPADSNVRELLQWAERGQEQERRRKDLEEITEQIDKALHAGDYSSAYTISDVGLLRFPEEPTLMRLRAISEKQRDIVERRSFVHDQSLAVKVLCDDGEFAEAIRVLTGALEKYPGEPNLESLLALTKAEMERHERLREESLRQEAMQRAEAEARAAYRQQILSWAVELRTALDAHESLDGMVAGAVPLRNALHENQVEDDHAKEVARLVLQELDARVHARDQVLTELQQLRQSIADPQNTLSLAEVDNRLLSAKSTYPLEPAVQQVCDELVRALEDLRRQRDETIATLTSLAQDLSGTPTGKLHALFQNARERAGSMAADPRVGALLQQLESGVTRRLQQREERLRDLHALASEVSTAHSLADLSRVRERGRAIAALDPSDEGLAGQFQAFDAQGSRRNSELTALMGELQALAQRVGTSATVADAEQFAAQAAALGAAHPDFQDLQEAVTRVSAQVQGRRMEHDLIVQELQSLSASIPTLASADELASVQARARECRATHAGDPEVCALSDAIETDVTAVLRALEQQQERERACDEVMEAARKLLRDQKPAEALAALLASEQLNPEREDLRQQIAIAREKVSQLQAEHEKAEAARIRQQGIVQEVENARALAASGNLNGSLKSLHEAAQRYASSPELAGAIAAIEVEIAREKAEQELAEKARIEQERAEKARIEQERAEKARIEQERAEKARIEQERAEKARIEQERAEKARIEQERAEKARIEQERAEKARIEQERAEKARIEQERAEKARIEQERAEKARLEQERAEKARIEQERAEKARIEQERAEKARIEQERAEKARIEQERAEKARLAEEQAEKARAEQERANRLRAEQAEAERLRAAQAREAKANARAARKPASRAEQPPLAAAAVSSGRRKPAALIAALLIGVVVLGLGLFKLFSSHPQPAPNPSEAAAPAPPLPAPPISQPGEVSPEPAGSLAIFAAGLPAASVSLDGHLQGNMASHRLDLAGLTPGPHVLTVAANNQQLHLQVQVTDQGSIDVTAAQGMEEQLVLAVTRAGDRQNIFCRCSGAEVRLNGKVLRAASPGRYQGKDRKQPTQELTLALRGDKLRLQFAANDASHALIFIESAAAAKEAEKQPLEVAKAAPPPLVPAPQPAQTSPAPQQAPPPAQPARTEDPAMAAWTNIQGTSDISALRNYRDKYPNSPMANVAELRMAELAWDAVKNSNQPADLERFQKEYPNSPHAHETNSKLTALTSGIEESNRQQRVAQDRTEVLQVLDAYKNAYEAKDVNRLAAAWPGAPRQKLQDTFKVIGKLTMSLTPDVPTIAGDTATVHCVQKLDIQSQGSTSANKTAIVFLLKRVQGKWVIDSLK